jgi:putative endonuclease
MYCVYILHSNSLDSYYIGETVDIEKRIKEHNTNSSLAHPDNYREVRAKLEYVLKILKLIK